jgi:hypothetical protein
VLFCPECGHENPADGDWLRDSETKAERCPECEAVLGQNRPPADD